MNINLNDGDFKFALFFREARKEIGFRYAYNFNNEIHNKSYKLGYAKALEDIEYSLVELYKKVRDRQMYNG